MCMRTVWQKLHTFVFYNNTLPIVLGVLLLSTGTVLASNEEVRRGVASSVVAAEERIVSVDNTYIINFDLEGHDFAAQVDEITEDDESYYVTFSYTTVSLEDYVWQPVEKQKELQIAKEQLGDKDLGVYVGKEMAEYIAYEKQTLRETQSFEQRNGVSKKVAEREYSGLIGRFLDPEKTTFDGYEPVKTPPEKVAQKPKEETRPVVERREQTTDDTNTARDTNDSDDVSTESQTETGAVDADTTDQDQASNEGSESSVTEEDNSADSTTDTATTTDDATSTTTVATSTASSSSDSTSETSTSTEIVLELLGAESVTVTVGDTYGDAGATVLVDGSASSSYQIEKTGTVDTDTAGEYELQYTVVDNTELGTVTRIVTVEAAEAEETATTTTNTNEEETATTTSSTTTDETAEEDGSATTTEEST